MGITRQHYFLRGCFFAGAAAFFTAGAAFLAGAAAFFAELAALFAGAVGFLDEEAAFFAGATTLFAGAAAFFAGTVAFFTGAAVFFAGAAAFFAATVALSACMIGSLAEVYSACCTAGAGASFCSVAVSFLPMVIVMYLMSSSSLLNQRSQK